MRTSLPGPPVPGGGSAPSNRATSALSRRALVGVAAALAGVPAAVGLSRLDLAGDPPEVNGATGWLNSTTLGSADLRGHVVLVNFWTLTCINWIRTAPYLRAWAQAYRDDGLIVVGVHTPEFSIERGTAAVEQAVRSRGITYPVAIDNDYEIWDEFHNQYWPALYFLGRDGVVADRHFGEGAYEKCERILQRLLGVHRELVRVEGTGVEAPADWAHLRSPETYLGYDRGAGHVSPADLVADRATAYAFPDELPLNTWGLSGDWVVTGEHVRQEASGASIAIRFRSRDVHLVMAPGAGDSVPFHVLLDDRVPGAAHGVDVDSLGRGTVRESRLYQLVRTSGEVSEHVLRVVFDGSGAEAYAFTFG